MRVWLLFNIRKKLFLVGAFLGLKELPQEKTNRPPGTNGELAGAGTQPRKTDKWEDWQVRKSVSRLTGIAPRYVHSGFSETK